MAKTHTRPKGRPSTSTPPVIELLVKAFSLGVSTKRACGYAGIDQALFGMWMRKAKTGLEPYLTLKQKIDDVKARRQARLVRYIDDAATEGDWRAAKHLLACDDPDHWSEKREVRHVGADGGAVKVVDLGSLTPELLRVLLESEGVEVPDYTGVEVPNRDPLV